MAVTSGPSRLKYMGEIHYCPGVWCSGWCIGLTWNSDGDDGDHEKFGWTYDVKIRKWFCPKCTSMYHKRGSLSV